jgi:hypothetical protein
MAAELVSDALWSLIGPLLPAAAPNLFFVTAAGFTSSVGSLF